MLSTTFVCTKLWYMCFQDTSVNSDHLVVYNRGKVSGGDKFSFFKMVL